MVTMLRRYANVIRIGVVVALFVSGIVFDPWRVFNIAASLVLAVGAVGAVVAVMFFASHLASDWLPAKCHDWVVSAVLFLFLYSLTLMFGCEGSI